MANLLWFALRTVFQSFFNLGHWLKSYSFLTSLMASFPRLLPLILTSWHWCSVLIINNSLYKSFIFPMNKPLLLTAAFVFRRFITKFSQTPAINITHVLWYIREREYPIKYKLYLSFFRKRFSSLIQYIWKYYPMQKSKFYC